MDKIEFALKLLALYGGEIADGKRIATEEQSTDEAYTKIMKLANQAEERMRAEVDSRFYKRIPRPIYLGEEW